MSWLRRTAAVADGGGRPGCAGAGGLLEQAVRYALGNVAVVTPDLLRLPTPCRGWDLDMLLRHSCESLATLAEGFASGCVRLPAEADADAADTSADGDEAAAAGPVELFVDRACCLLAGWAGSGWSAVAVGGWPLAIDVVAIAGALEIAVHGWDIAQASGSRLPIPSPLAGQLLDVAPLLVTGADRESPTAAPRFAAPLFAAPPFAAPLFAAPLFAAPLFAAPVAVSCEASASDKLTAFLGRPGLG
jgi:uncharacterized protein (TIGR03083 family)